VWGRGPPAGEVPAPADQPEAERDPARVSDGVDGPGAPGPTDDGAEHRDDQGHQTGAQELALPSLRVVETRPFGRALGHGPVLMDIPHGLDPKSQAEKCQ